MSRDDVVCENVLIFAKTRGREFYMCTPTEPVIQYHPEILIKRWRTWQLERQE